VFGDRVSQHAVGDLSSHEVKDKVMGWTTKRFEKEMHKFDPLLRLRESQTEPGVLFVERKAERESKCIPLPKERRGIDRWRRDCEGHVLLLRTRKDTLSHQVLLELRAHDMWEYRGAGPYADALEAQEAKEQEAQQRTESNILQDAGEEAYDRAMIKQGDIVSGFKSKVGGYEPSTAKNVS
jgi:hypothetical protein